MRIDRLHIENFKKYAKQDWELHPQFTLFVGDNGSGKTTVLDALAVAMGIWLVDPPDSSLANSRRNIYANEIRLVPSSVGDRLLFREAEGGVVINATGSLGPRSSISWTRQIRPGGERTTNADAQEARVLIADLFRRDGEGEKLTFPIIAYYGAGRAWLPSRDRTENLKKAEGKAKRWAAFYDCLFERIRPTALRDWFRSETVAMGNLGGKTRPGFEVVRRAILACVPEGRQVSFDGDRNEIVLTIGDQSQPFDNLSAGQRMMLATVADLAIKMVTQNNYLVPAVQLGPEDEPIPRVLRETPGVVLIDEIDVHLHPSWQRRLFRDLTRTFPAVQFVCTTHSPQVIGEVPRDCIWVLEGDSLRRPAVSKGADSNWLLEHVLPPSKSRNQDAQALIERTESALANGQLDGARAALAEMRRLLDGEDGAVARLEAELGTLEALTRENDPKA